MDILPLELVELIISFLNSDSKLVARAVNKQLFNIIDKRDFVTYYVTKDQIGQVVDTFSRCGKPIYLHFKKNKFGGIKDIANHITKLSNLIGLEIEMLREPAEVSDWMALTVLTDLQHLDTYNIPRELYNHLIGLSSLQHINEADLDFLACLSKLQQLHFMSPNTYNPFALISNPRLLTELNIIGSISFKPEDLHPFVSLKVLMFRQTKPPKQILPIAMFSKLESLDIEAIDIDEYPASLTSLGVSDVPPHHLTKLTKLEYLRVTYSEAWSITQKQELMMYIKSLGLKELRLLQMNIPDSETCANCFNELTKLTRLEHLTISMERFNADATTLMRAINSSTNLVRLSIHFPRRMLGVTLKISAALSKLEDITVSRCGRMIFENASLMTSLKAVNGIHSSRIGMTDLLCLTQLERLYHVHHSLKWVDTLTKFQHLTSLSVTSVGPKMSKAIGQLTKLRMLTINEECSPNIEEWTNLRQLTWLDPRLTDPRIEQKLTLLTSLERFTPFMNESLDYRLDQQMLLEKMPRLYDIDVSFY